LLEVQRIRFTIIKREFNSSQIKSKLNQGRIAFFIIPIINFLCQKITPKKKKKNDSKGKMFENEMSNKKHKSILIKSIKAKK
jgi:hypothetical protein